MTFDATDDQSLTGLVRRGDINFEQLVKILSTRGYITTLDKMPELPLSKVRIDRVHQDDFDTLFSVLFSGQVHDIHLMTDATCEGAMPGLYTTALFNLTVIDYDEMRTLLIEINQGEL
jgi:hypothetical protein